MTSMQAAFTHLKDYLASQLATVQGYQDNLKQASDPVYCKPVILRCSGRAWLTS